MANRVRKVETRGPIWLVEWRREEMFDRSLTRKCAVPFHVVSATGRLLINVSPASTLRYLFWKIQELYSAARSVCDDLFPIYLPVLPIFFRAASIHHLIYHRQIEFSSSGNANYRPGFIFPFDILPDVYRLVPSRAYYANCRSLSQSRFKRIAHLSAHKRTSRETSRPSFYFCYLAKIITRSREFLERIVRNSVLFEEMQRWLFRDININYTFESEWHVIDYFDRSRGRLEDIFVKVRGRCVSSLYLSPAANYIKSQFPERKPSGK